LETQNILTIFVPNKKYMKGFKLFFAFFAILFISIIGFNIYNFSQSEDVIIKVKDKYIFTDISNKSSTVHYRIIDENTGEYFDCTPMTLNQTGPEKLYNSFEKNKLYTVEARGIKSDYNVRSIVNIK